MAAPSFRKLVLLAGTLTYVTLSLRGATATEPANVTFCALAARPERFNNLSVSFVAHYESDGLHGSYLSDPSCNQALLGLDWSQATEGVREFDIATSGGLPGTADKTVIGRFTGIFRWLPNRRRERLLELRSVRVITVRRKKPPF